MHGFLFFIIFHSNVKAPHPDLAYLLLILSFWKHFEKQYCDIDIEDIF